MSKKYFPALAAAAVFMTGCSSASGGSQVGADEVKYGQGATEDTIKVALLNDFSGPIAPIGTAAAVGSEAYFEARNTDGGICARQVEVIREDTKYDPQVTVQAYRAISDDVVAIPQLLGAASIMAVKDDIARDNIMTLPATQTGSMMTLENLFLYLPPYQIENINGLAWATENVEPASDGPLRVATVNPADEYGKEFQAAAEYAAEHLDIELVKAVTFTNTDEDFTAQVKALSAAKPDVVLLNTTPKQTAGLLGQSAQFGFKPTWIGQGGTWASALAPSLGKLTDNYYVVNSVASLEDDAPGVQKLTSALEEHFPGEKPDNMMVTGWVTGAVAGAALDKACENKDITPEGVVAAMKDLEVGLDGVAPDIDMGDGKSPVARESRVNSIDPKTGALEPVTDWFASDPATSWSLDAD